MRSPLLGFLILLACASETAAHGSIAWGYDATNTIQFNASQNEPTVADAQAAALQACRAAGLTSCFMYVNFQNQCTAVGKQADGSFQAGLGEDADAASRAVCSRNSRFGCRAHNAAIPSLVLVTILLASSRSAE